MEELTPDEVMEHGRQLAAMADGEWDHDHQKMIDVTASETPQPVDSDLPF